MCHGPWNVNTKVICPLEKPGTAYQAKQHHTPGDKNPTKHIFETPCIDNIFRTVEVYGHENSPWYGPNVIFLYLFLYASNVRFALT